MPGFGSEGSVRPGAELTGDGSLTPVARHPEVPGATRSLENIMEVPAVEAAAVNLRSDHVAGVAPEILAAIAAANAGTAPSYGADPITARLQGTFAELFEPADSSSRWRPAPQLMRLRSPCSPRRMAPSTAATSAACTTASAGQASSIPAAPRSCRWRESTAGCVPRRCVRRSTTPGRGYTGRVQPAVLNLTQATERGTVHRLEQIDELVGIARPYGLRVHMDGRALPTPSPPSAAARRTSPGGAASTFSRSA